MFSVWTVAAVVLGYLCMLFLVAFWGDRKGATHRQHPIVYSLALGVQCTSWAFFGTTTQAALYGWAVVPTYLGIALVMVFGFSALRRISQICQRHNISSLADFIGLQYQKSHLLAALVTVLCFFGVVPYIALQLGAVSRSFALITSADDPWPGNIGIYVTALMALFAILFGTRSMSLTDKHPGLMLTIAFESVVKLAALVIVGLFVCYSLFDGVFDLLGKAQLNQHARTIITADSGIGVFISHVLLGIAGMFCLPRQFHINFIENNGDEELRHARWLFPGYLLAMSLFVLPLALAGHLLFAPGTVSTDIYTLALPVAADSPMVTLIGFLGGLSAATSMVIVATLAVGIMISNNLVTPLWLTVNLRTRRQHTLKPASLLLIRRITVVLVLGIAYLYHVDVSQSAPLVKSGIIAAALLAQTLPIILLGLYWQRGHRIAAQVSLLAGAVCWFYWLLWPSIKSSYYFDPPPTDWALGLGFMLSLLVNTACFVVLSVLLSWRRPASAYPGLDAGPQHYRAIKINALLALTDKVLNPTAQRNLDQWVQPDNNQGYASPALLERAERELASQVGRASARILLSAVAEKDQVALPELVELVEEASQTFQFNHELLQSSVEHIQQGISVVDRDMTLLAWNQRYVEMFDYPRDFIKVGLTIRELLTFNAQRGMLGDVKDLDQEIDKRIAYLKQGSRYKYLRHQQDGRVIELNGSPLPGGGFVTTYSDITEYITIQRQLQDAKTHLEERVAQRTDELQRTNALLADAKQAADAANDSKTKFLAAAGHDLMQPFNAASLFASLIAQRAQNTDIKDLSANLIQSLNSAEELLSMLLDMTRLESGALVPQIQSFAATDILSPLVEEFRLIAAQKGLCLEAVPTSVWIRSDKKLLRRVLQNLLSNAIRYTATGKVLIGVRRRPTTVEFQVLDSGPGIAERDQKAIFKEFNQLHPQQGKSGLGLGLTIVDRIAALLGHPLRLHSQVNVGTLFAVSVPRSEAQTTVSQAVVVRSDSGDKQWLSGVHILVCDNEPQTLNAVSALLQEWGAQVTAISGVEEAQQLAGAPDLMLLDYHLHHGQTGVEVADVIRRKFNLPVPGILNSADRTESIRSAATNADLHYLPKPLKPAAFKRLCKQLALSENNAYAE
ncbi:hybrid sensor histidine kinase/response regulator [Aestuariibacter halophilus]|uniref:histidine kinase n=1 Tax=Fluctibacter halophilus TaxID=226011 RepID=A0ABS8G9Z6_9ALTE|nr:PAS domain-containing hybrid sensor histidine kinase/response regulator [Aestuariibacter halophilus]MCC2616051.1 hybrid sensor histidine kinase/response regulator [Aestuariibacter halophilus]